MIITLSIIVIAGFMMPMHYSSSTYKANNITTGTNNTYPIYLTGVPKGNGTYQQLITINNYSKYGINDNGSNIEFFDSSNYTHLYAWIQSINATSMQVWIKNYNASNVIDMQVLQSFENLFNATGYLGDNTTNNAKYVFLAYNGNVSMNGHGAIAAIWVGGTSSGFVQDGFTYPHVSVNNGLAGGVSIADTCSNFFTGQKIIPNIYNTTAIYESYGTANSTDIISTNWLVNNWTSIQTINISKPGNLEYVGYDSGYANANTTRIYYWEYGVDVPNGIMPTFTIGISLYHSIDFKLIGSSTSFQWSISINGTIYNATSSNIYFNMTNGYYNIIVNLPSQYYAIAKGVLKVNNTNEIFRITVVSQNTNNFSNDIMYAIILASIIIAVALYFSRRN